MHFIAAGKVDQDTCFLLESNAFDHNQPKIKGIFKHKLSMIVSLGRLLIDFFSLELIVTCQ